MLVGADVTGPDQAACVAFIDDAHADGVRSWAGYGVDVEGEAAVGPFLRGDLGPVDPYGAFVVDAEQADAPPAFDFSGEVERAAVPGGAVVALVALVLPVSGDLDRGPFVQVCCFAEPGLFFAQVAGVRSELPLAVEGDSLVDVWLHDKHRQ